MLLHRYSVKTKSIIRDKYKVIIINLLKYHFVNTYQSMYLFIHQSVKHASSCRPTQSKLTKAALRAQAHKFFKLYQCLFPNSIKFIQLRFGTTQAIYNYNLKYDYNNYTKNFFKSSLLSMLHN